jgi:hypothetical protein
MQKSHSKLGLLVVLSCLALMIGMMAMPDGASAHQRRHHNVTPRIVMKLVRGSVHRERHHYVARAVIYGVGFSDCNSCGDCNNSCTDSCDSCGSSSGNACSSYYYYNVNTCNTTCSYYNACGNSGSSSNTTCSYYNACGNSGSSSNTTCSNYNACGSSTSGSSSTTTTTTCSSYNACGNSACDCANIQSNAHISSQNVNLSQVPVNAFGEFHITVQVQLVPTVSTASYRVWAVNRSSGQSSNVLTCPCN